ncbi:16007_t:CDS:1 [Funneliformis geosporum]|uniref:3053_t:CDS:1 n=1 Tax=Funneliformis geosporum TaxID=1117311 RepID=A0A9W4SE77_9GLOM|nr:16007_t:CDS:1 [Funneliformis geosporum]CAI2165803.1 3053_t:CDS:1 [Funneliformis geosporum]
MKAHSFTNKPNEYCRHTLTKFNDISMKDSFASKLTYDCLEEICKHLKNDKASLFSCVLLNRSWCKMAIPVLWSRPFENPMYGNNLNIFWIYISCLSMNDKQRLENKGIRLSNPSQRPLFDYPKYLRGFDCLNFQIALNQWVGKTGLHFNSNNLMDKLSPTELKFKTELCNQILGPYLLSHSKNLRHLKYDHDSTGILNILTTYSSNEFFQMFIKLETLEFKDTIFHENWVSRAERISQFASKLSLCNRKLHNISIALEIGMKKQIQPKYCRPILELIKSQNSLKNLEICEFWNSSCSNLFFDALKSQSNSLTYLSLTRLSQYHLLLPVLCQCNNLVTLEFWTIKEHDERDLDFAGLTCSKRQLSIKKFICYDHGDDPDFLTLVRGIIIRMANKNLRELKFQNVTVELLDLIHIYTSNISNLYLTIDYSTLLHLLPILSSLRNLEYLYLFEYKKISLTFELIVHMAKSIPKSLYYLDVTFQLTPVMLKILLENCPARLNVLVLHIDGMDDKYLKVLIEYAERYQSLDTFKFDGNNIKFSHEMYNKAERVISVIRNFRTFTLK